jgi:hypothetical protein
MVIFPLRSGIVLGITLGRYLDPQNYPSTIRWCFVTSSVVYTLLLVLTARGEQNIALLEILFGLAGCTAVAHTSLFIDTCACTSRPFAPVFSCSLVFMLANTFAFAITQLSPSSLWGVWASTLTASAAYLMLHTA